MRDIWTVAAGEFLGSFAAVFGALLVFSLETRRDRTKQRRAEEWELAGLLLFPYDEISGSRETLNLYAQDIRRLWSSAGPLPPSDSVSEDTKVRIARLADPDTFTDLVRYYKFLRLLLRAREHDPEQVDTSTAADTVKLLLRETTGIKATVRKYLRAYDETQPRPWWRRVFRR